MILLTSTSDKLQIITTAAGQIDVHASWADASGSPVTVAVGRTNTRISTAATTDVVAAPAASTSRNVKNIKIGNNHATVSNTVTLQHTDGSNVIILEQVTLAPLERVGYEEGVGIRVFDALGRERLPTAPLVQTLGNIADITASSANTLLSALQVGGRVIAGSGILWRCRMSKTAVGTSAATFTVLTGTAGTTADTARVTHTLAAQTAAVDDGYVEVSAVLRALGASAVIESSLVFTHSGASVGLDNSIGAGLIKRLQANSSTFTLGTADYLSLACNPGATGSPVWTFQEVLAIPLGFTG